MEKAMTPQERQLIDDLFDRLAKLETTPRDPEAMSAIMQGLRKAPNSVYALVQTALLQDEALKRANSHIQELEAALSPEQNQSGQAQSGGFLDSMRGAVFGQGQPPGSVPNVRAPDLGGRPVWNSGQVLQQSQAPGHYGQEPYGQSSGGQSYGGGGQPYGGQSYGAPQPPLGGGGGSFLGTAAAAAAGMVGGSLLLGSIRSMMGGGGHQAFADSAGLGGLGGNQKSSSDQSGSDLARDAGINDVGSSSGQRADDTGSRAGLFDQASNDDDGDTDHDSDGFDDDGDSDYA
jgi:uncharacterized protein